MKTYVLNTELVALFKDKDAALNWMAKRELEGFQVGIARNANGQWRALATKTEIIMDYEGDKP